LNDKYLSALQLKAKKSLAVFAQNNYFPMI